MPCTTALIQRMIEPGNVASMVAYVASPFFAATNGAALRVDGGITPTPVSSGRLNDHPELRRR